MKTFLKVLAEAKQQADDLAALVTANADVFANWDHTGTPVQFSLIQFFWCGNPLATFGDKLASAKRCARILGGSWEAAGAVLQSNRAPDYSTRFVFHDVFDVAPKGVLFDVSQPEPAEAQA